MNSEEREYWKDITYRCERKYEFLIDKLALLLDKKGPGVNRDYLDGCMVSTLFQ